MFSNLKYFSQRLAQAVAFSKSKPRRIAIAVGISPSYLSDLLAEKKENPSLLVMQRLAAATGVAKKWLISGEGEMAASDHERALAPSVLAGGHSIEAVMREDATPYRTSDSPEGLLRDEIMSALNAAQLSPDELRQRTLHQRIDEYFVVLKKKGPPP